MTIGKISLLAAGAALMLSACSGGEARYPTGYDRSETNGDIYAERQSIFGKDGIPLFNRTYKFSHDDVVVSTVNPHLWQAALGTASFLPLVTADRSAGTVVTDWYRIGDSNDRYRTTIKITGKELDGRNVHVVVNHQAPRKAGWADLPDDTAKAAATGKAVLEQARKLSQDK